MSGEEGPDCQGIVRAMYLFSKRVPVDAAPLLADRCHNYLERLFQRLRRATAFQMMTFQLDLRFPPGVVEFDGTRAPATRTEPKARVITWAAFSSPATGHFFPLPLKFRRSLARAIPSTERRFWARGVPPLCLQEQCKHRLLAAPRQVHESWSTRPEPPALSHSCGSSFPGSGF